MCDLFKKLQAAAMLAQELHISLVEAEKELNTMFEFRNQLEQQQKEAAVMVDEMLD